MATPVRLTRADFEVLSKWLTAWEVGLPFGTPERPTPGAPGVRVPDVRAYLADLRAALKDGPGESFDTAVEQLRWLALFYGSVEAKDAARIDALLQEHKSGI